ncbi:MAG TPA: glycosyltransferase family 39 protein [Stellaceae bacterium]|nr:glycosyltransferase family 39 protein [Stellaceae bacterium]
MRSPAATTPLPDRGAPDRRARICRALALPGAIAAVALLLRLYGLGDKPLWLDEATTLQRVSASLDHLVLDALRNRHYPSYFIMLWPLARLGHTAWLLRLPSAIFGALAAALACAVGRRAGGPKSGAVAGLLLAFSPFEVQFGQEARSYTLVSALVLLALWGLVRLAREPAAAALPWRQEGALRGAWLAYALGTAGALSVLGAAIPWLAAANLAAIAIARDAGAARRAFMRRWGLWQFFVLAAWAPSLGALFLFHQGGIARGADWAPTESLASVWSALAPVYLLRISTFVTNSLAPAAVPGLSLAVAALAIFGVWRLRREAAVLATLLCAVLLLPIALLLLSPIVPVLVPRYFAWSAAPFFVLAGAGLGAIPGKLFATLSVGLTAAALVNLLPYYGYETKPRWDLAAQELAEKAKPGDVVLADRGYTYNVFAIYAEQAKLAEHGLKVTAQLGEAAAAAPGHDVWALYGRIGQSDIVPADDYLRTLAPLGQPDAEYKVGRYITLYRFEAPAARPNGAPREAAQPQPKQ